MPKTTIDTWDAQFPGRSPFFQILSPASGFFTQTSRWPSLDEYRTVFRDAGMRVTPVAQDAKPSRFEDLYESRVYLKGELQTRLRNWHDFFNALVWLSFPKTKSVLNELHYFSSLQRDEKTNRSALENAITLFDECGAVVIGKREELLQMIRDHQWKRLFVDHRSCFENEIQCIVFGHATYEKILKPYPGITAHCLLICSEDLLHSGSAEIDEYLADYWKQVRVQSTKDLTPLPLLGVPGCYAENEAPGFYDNTGYFRPRR